MKVLIVEDEIRAAKRLTRIVTSYASEITVLDVLPSLANVRDWFRHNPQPDLVFLDIQLEDGSSFEAVDEGLISAPIIFCTAYHQFALKAFTTNSIDYLLKPISENEVFKALAKYQRFTGFQMDSASYRQINWEGSHQPEYRQQFLVALAGRFTPVKSANIVAIQSYLKAANIIDKHGKEWLLEASLNQIESSLDPAMFQRISRQWIVAVAEIRELLHRDEGSYVQMKTLPQQLKISRSKVKMIKQILNR